MTIMKIDNLLVCSLYACVRSNPRDGKVSAMAEPMLTGMLDAALK